MLELIFQGFLEWAYGLALECWQYFSTALLDIMSMDFAYLKSHAPVVDEIMQILLAVGWALLIGNLVFQALKSMAVGLGFEGEDPKLLFARTFVFAFLLLASPQICEIGLSMTSKIIELLQIPDAVNVTFVDESVFGAIGAAWLLVIIFGIIVMFKVFKLLLEIAERYVILAMLTITAPLAFAMGGSKSTSEIFTGWCRMFGSMCLLMVTNVIFFKMLLSVLATVPSGLDVLPWIVLILTIVKVARKADAIVTRIGLNPAITGDSLGRGLPGTLTYMVVRSAASQITKAVGKSAGNGGKGAAPNAPSGGPRMGGPSGGHGNTAEYRIVPGLMLKDGKRYKSPGDFDAEYGVIENTYEIQDAEYNSNRRTSKRRTKSKQLPGVSPLVFSRFLLEYTAFLSLSDMGKNLPDYEEIPVPLEMPEDVRTAYKEAEHELQKVLRTDRKAAQKILSTYLNLLTVYPDQPYDQPEVVHPINGMPIVTPKNCGDFSRLFPKEERVLELVRQKAANGERVLIYTSWTRTDSQKKLQKLLCSEGYRTEILTPQIATDKREDWVNKRVKNGLQVLVTNPRCVETGLDLNAFTTIIFYSMGYNLFTLRQASRRSWRINQTAPRVEVHMLYYADTMQAKAMKLMASKLAVAGIIEGTFSEEGLAAMSDVKDLTSQMAKELALGIRDNVEDIAAAFRKMAVINPERKKNIAAAQLKETAAEEQKAPAAKDSFGVRTAQAQVRQALYEGLLARTAEEQKKRKSKKAEVDENQLSIFGFAA